MTKLYVLTKTDVYMCDKDDGKPITFESPHDAYRFAHLNMGISRAECDDINVKLLEEVIGDE